MKKSESEHGLSHRVNVNGSVLEALPEPLAGAMRGLWYGDSLFETIRVFDGQIPFWPWHWERLQMGMTQMGYAIPAEWTQSYVKEQIMQVAPEQARIRLTVWRSPGGLYAPLDHTPQFLITAQSLKNRVFDWLSEGLHVSICQSVRLPVDAYSGLKTLNAPRYVAAAREAQQTGCNDVVILNAFERVCECTGGNIFWWSGEQLYTPPPSDGALTGTMQKMLLLLMSDQDCPVVFQSVTPDALFHADEIFITSSVRGIAPVHFFEGRVLETKRTYIVFEALVKRIQQLLSEKNTVSGSLYG